MSWTRSGPTSSCTTAISTCTRPSRRTSRDPGCGTRTAASSTAISRRSPRPRLSVKVAYFLTDVSEPGRGNFVVVPGSHLAHAIERPPDDDDELSGSVPVLARAGDAVLFDRRLWHMRSRNVSRVTRKALFYAYTFRWVRARDELDVRADLLSHLSRPSEPSSWARQLGDRLLDAGRRGPASPSAPRTLTPASRVRFGPGLRARRAVARRRRRPGCTCRCPSRRRERRTSGALQRVVAALPGQGVRTLLALERVVPLPAEHEVIAAERLDVIVARRARRSHRSRRCP